MKALDSKTSDRPDHFAEATATPALHESEIYLEHRLALDATLFASPASQLVTFELDDGNLSLVAAATEADRPRK